MLSTISNKITIEDPIDEIWEYAKLNLVFDNPEYQKKQRMGFWLGNTPKKLYMYETNGNKLILPYGTLDDIAKYIRTDSYQSDFADTKPLDMDVEIPLYDYQQRAVEVMYNKGMGILQAPAGSGKTQMGIALACKYKKKALWVTHTTDLLNQSYNRAKQYINEEKLGRISAGKVDIGEWITFATVQTLSKCDLSQWEYEWDVIVVDECHRVASNPTQLTMFSKVLNSLAARHKFGLSATVHRADGMIKGTFAQIGRVTYMVSEKDVGDKIVKVGIKPRYTGVKTSLDILNTDGTLDYTSLLEYLSENGERNNQIVQDLKDNKEHFNLILSDRISHLEMLKKLLDSDDSVMITGKMQSKKAKAEREQAIDDMRDGKKHYLFATYSLAKEGLDVPRMDRLYLTTPQKDYAVIVQSVGRIARSFPNKCTPYAYDYIDCIQYCERAYKKRWTSYKKINCFEVE